MHVASKMPHFKNNRLRNKHIFNAIVLFTSSCLLPVYALNNALPFVGSRIANLRSSCHQSLVEDQDRGSEVLTAQERILRDVLDIQPETQSEKALRLKQRQELLNKSQDEKKKNLFIAILGISLGILNYAWQYQNPVTSISLLTEMQNNSAELNVIGNNGKPTLVEFWAPWCENCKSAAPTMAVVEEEYKGRVNFVMVNGDRGDSWPIVERFGVDAIPHVALVGSDGFVETALIGPIPRKVLKADLDCMLRNSENGQNKDFEKKILPYTMFNAFRSSPELRQMNFSKEPSPIVLGRHN